MPRYPASQLVRCITNPSKAVLPTKPLKGRLVIDVHNMEIRAIVIEHIALFQAFAKIN